MTKAKISGNYVNSMMTKTLALRSGFDEAVLLDPEGFVAECTGENLFLVRKGVIYTPPAGTILEGITRATLMTLAVDLGFPVVETQLSRDQLYIADEVFICGTAAEVVGVREIDFRTVGTGGVGPVTHSLQNAFYQAVRGEAERYGGWLDLVKMETVAN